MKKTILITIALIGILAIAFVAYQNYYDQYDPSQLGPSGIYSDQNGEAENNSQSVDEAENKQGDSTEDDASDVTPALDFTVYNQANEPVNLSDYYGKPIIVNFWATWCGPCKSELPALENLYQKYGEDIQFMMVNLTDGAQETVEGVSDFIVDNGYTFPVYFDTDMNAAVTYSVFSIPATLFIDADGNIVASHLGAMTESTLENYIELLLN